MTSIFVVGLGKLGLPMAACFAQKGHLVYGFDSNPNVLKKLQSGQVPIFEPYLNESLKRSKKRFQTVSSIDEGISLSDVTFVVVPTPSDSEGGFSLQYVKTAMRMIGSALGRKQSYHLVVLTSTVLPGSMDREISAILETCSRKKIGAHFGLCYNPEFIALGSVIRNILNPDFILIGESDRKSGNLLEKFYKNLCENKPKFARMNWVSAELAKLSVNTFVTTKISYANMLAEICEKLPGANVHDVTRALGFDSRIGAKYLTGAIGYGGPCFPRDNKAFVCAANQLRVKASLALATDEINERQSNRLEKIVLKHARKNSRVSILGLAYKPDTNVVEEAPGLKLAQQLGKRGIKVLCYDSIAAQNAQRILGRRVSFAKSLRESVKRSDIIVITTSSSEFKNISPNDLKRKTGKVAVIDCWQVLDSKKYKKVSQYLRLGIGPIC